MFPAEIFRMTLERIVKILNQHAVQFHLTGGITSIAYGEPRLTQDMDLVVDRHALAANLTSFLQSLESHHFLHQPAAIHRAIEQLRLGDLCAEILSESDEIER